MESSQLNQSQTKLDNVAQLFIDAAYYGYIGGLRAMLDAGMSPSHGDWVDALQGAAIAQHKEVVDFLLWQFVTQKADIIVDSDWIIPIERRNVELARKVETCDWYVRSVRMRNKLLEKGVKAPEVEVPAFLKGADDQNKIYAFGKDRESDIVGDHSQRRRASMEANAKERSAATQAPSNWGSNEAILVSNWMDQNNKA